MHAIEALLSRPEVERLGWVLLHFLWQGAIGAAVVAAALFAMRRASANARYLVACAVLLAMAACLPVTWLTVPQRSSADHSAITAMESVSIASTHGTKELIPRNDGGIFIELPGKPLDEPLAKRPLQTDSMIDAPPTAAAAPGMTWQQRIAVGLPWLAVVWLGGVLILSLRLAIGWSAVRRLRRAALQPADDSRQAVLSRLSRQLGIHWPVKLLESALVEVPTMIGWLRPAILWPPSVLAGLSVEQFESLLAHELAHVRRHDYLVNLIQTAIETLLFYHPAVWWVSNRIRQERECCCDDLAVATCGNRISYARALTALEELRPRPRKFALAADGGRLLTRIRRIIGQPAPRRSAGTSSLLGIAILAAALCAVLMAIRGRAIGDDNKNANDDSTPVAAHAIADSAATVKPNHRVVDLEERKFGNSNGDGFMPEDLGERIKQLSHVVDVKSGLTDVVSFPRHELPAVVINGLSLHSFEMTGWKLKAGRFLTPDDRRKVILGSAIAADLGTKVGDFIEAYSTKLEIVGIFESQIEAENSTLATTLTDLQEFMGRPRQATRFLVRTDLFDGPSSEDISELSALSKHIESQADGIESTILNSKESIDSRIRRIRRLDAQRLGTEVWYQVVDDETNRPILPFSIQWGLVGPSGIDWRAHGGTLITDNASGKIVHSPENKSGQYENALNWNAGFRARIIAAGYIPEPIFVETPKPGMTTVAGVVVRMKRGRTISGRVFDHLGKPVASANLYVVGTLPGIQFSGGKASPLAGPLTQAASDADGKFSISGIGWDASCIAVCTSGLDLWIVRVPPEAHNDFQIRLPHAGRLVVRYDVPNAPDEAKVYLNPVAILRRYNRDHLDADSRTIATVDSREPSAAWPLGVGYQHEGVVKQRGEIVFDNLPPGDYEIGRSKPLGVHFDSTSAFLDAHVETVRSGATTISTGLVRNKGAIVYGRVVGLDRPEVLASIPHALIINVRNAGDRFDIMNDRRDYLAKRSDEIILSPHDEHSEPADGRFATEKLLPGQYRITAQLRAYPSWEKYIEGSTGRFVDDGNIEPSFIGDAIVTVPENGKPAPVTIELHRFEERTADRSGDPRLSDARIATTNATPATANSGNSAVLTRMLSGHAVDAETGQPVQGFIYEEATFDERDPKRFHWNGDAIGPGSQRDGEFGIVVKNQPGKPIWARIVAPGYVPQPITEKPIVLGDDAVLDKLVVKMHRGKELGGRVVDSTGKPVADAGVYLFRNQGRRQVVRDSAVPGPNQQFEMLAITHAATNADGRFKMTGWDAESGRVAILSGEMNLWVTAIPADTADWTIHLPHPATIECFVDDDRGERDTLYDLDFLTASRKGWEMLRAYQFSLRSKDGRLVMANHTPGQYELTRRRRVAVGDYEGEFHLADVKLQVNPGDVSVFDLQRRNGWPIAGQVVGLKELGLSGTVISVEPPGEVKRGAMTFDALTCGEDGRFETGRIPPGKYRVHVDAYLPKKPADPHIFSGGLDLPPSARMPDFTADADVTITKDEQPAKLMLDLKKGGESRAFRELMQYHEQSHPATIDEFTASPWAVAPPNADRIEKPKLDEPPAKAATPKSLDRSVVDLTIVQRIGASSQSKGLLPGELGDRIRKLPHVTAVAGIWIDSIYESDGITVPEVDGLFIRTDIPKDGSQEHLDQVAELKKRIAGLKDGIVAIEPPSDSKPSVQPANGTKPAEKPKPTVERDNAKKARERDGRDLIVQKRGESAALNYGLPEELGDRIMAVPHVTAVSGGLMDVVSFPEHQLAAVMINGLPPDSPMLAEWTLNAGRIPKAGDQDKVIVGANLAKSMKVRVGDKIRTYDSDVEVVGIFESKNVFENGSIAMLLTDLQKFMDRPKQVTGFIVRTDVSRDDSPENRAVVADLRKRIEALGEGIAAFEKPPEKPREKAKREAPAPESKPIDVHGQVLDDTTGKPIALFDVQGGHVDPKDATKTTWGYYLRPNAGGVEGRFDANIDWAAGWRARIIASGYLPQPILTESPKAGQTKIEGLVLRMKRGREVSGRVVDHAGKPVKDAALFVVGSRPMEISGGQALTNSSQGVVEDRSAGRYSTDADGRFTLTGIGEDAKNIAVSCRAVDLWIVPAPATDEAAKGFEIRLPAPGKLIVHYDIPGGPEEATIFLQLHTWDRDGWKGVDNRRRPTVKQHGELVLDNMTPGLYEVVRDSGGFLDRRQVTIEPGKTVTTDFIRKAGVPITGRVVGLDREDVQKAKPKHVIVTVHKPGEERNPVAPKFATVSIEAFDKDGKPSDGSFKTELIPPGEYLVRASVFIEETPEQRYRTGIIPPGFEGEAKVTVPEQGAPPPVEIQLKKWEYKPLEIKKAADAPKDEAPKELPKKPAGESPAAHGSNRLSEPPADKGFDDAVKQGLQAVGNKPDGDEAAKAAVTKGLLYLAQKQAKEAAAGAKAPDEVVTKVDPALVAELLALDAMRAGTSTAFDRVDEAGRKLLEKYQKPEEQGLIYFILLQIHGDSGLQTPKRIISYAQQALKYPLGSRHELRVYIYWGDTLNVQKTEKPLPEQRKEAAAVYLKGLKLAWMYPETPPAVPDPPPRYDGPEGPEQSARQKAWEHYRDLRNKADFIKEVNYDRAIFIRQIADMYHRPPAAAATPVEIDAPRKQAAEILQNDAAVARLMAAINPDPDAVRFGNAALPAFDINSKTTPADAVHVGNAALPADAPKEEAPKEDPKQTPPKESSKQEAYDSAFKRGLKRLIETPTEKNFDDAVKQGLQAIGRKQSEEAAQPVPDEVTISIPPALAAELRALDAMRAGTSTNFEKVDEKGEKLLDRFHEPDERGQIYYALLQVHGQSGLVTPEHIIEYAKQALNHRLGSRQELMVYIYWGDTLNVRKTETPWSEQRIQAAFVYLSGLRRLWQYNVPEQPPELPAPPPRYDGPEGPEREAAVAAMKHYMELKNKVDFIKELIYQRQIFIRQIADMYHRRPATNGEIEALRQLAKNLLANETAVDRLMAAVEADPKKAGEQSAGGLTKLAIGAVADDKREVKKASEEIGDEPPWSKQVNRLKARLSFGRGKGTDKGSSSIFTFLELSYDGGGGSDLLTIPLDPAKIEFKVTDAAGKEVPIKSLDSGVDTYTPKLEIPSNSQLRLYLRGSISETTFKEPSTILSLALDRGCIFPRGDTGEYTLHAKFTIPKADHDGPVTASAPRLLQGIDADGGDWHGTIELPPVRIPLNK